MDGADEKSTIAADRDIEIENDRIDDIGRQDCCLDRRHVRGGNVKDDAVQREVRGERGGKPHGDIGRAALGASHHEQTTGGEAAYEIKASHHFIPGPEKSVVR